MLTYQTAGESHGKGIAALVDGFPSGVSLDIDSINRALQRRQSGYGRGGRQQIETDRVEIQSGILRQKSTGSPILLWVKNKDEKIDVMPELDHPRPGHGDLPGALKYFCDIRPVLERASARETAGRVAAGALAALLLKEFQIAAIGYVVGIGPLSFESARPSASFSDPGSLASREIDSWNLAEIQQRRDASELFTLFPERDAEAKALIDRCQAEGDTLGGIVEVRVFHVPFGLGTHLQWDRKLDGRLAAAAMAVQAIKGVEIGWGFEAAKHFGSEVHDPIEFCDGVSSVPHEKIHRPTNHSGGLEAGMTNGQPIVVRAAMKPIATLRKPLASFDLRTGKPVCASYERSDVCAISATSVVMENVVAFEIAAALIDKFGGDALSEMLDRFHLFQEQIDRRLTF